MRLSNKVYDILKYITLIGLPALGALYFGLSKIWNLPYGGEVAGTVEVVCVFLGALIGISTANYKKGQANDGGDA